MIFAMVTLFLLFETYNWQRCTNLSYELQHIVTALNKPVQYGGNIVRVVLGRN